MVMLPVWQSVHLYGSQPVYVCNYCKLLYVSKTNFLWDNKVHLMLPHNLLGLSLFYNPRSWVNGYIFVYSCSLCALMMAPQSGPNL